MSYFDSVRSRLLDQINDVYTLSNLHEWIQKKTLLEGNPYSFVDHEYQIPLLSDSSQIMNVVKCAQVGASEMFYRWAVAACCTQDDFTVIYTFPSSGDAEKNNATRINPMIDQSPELKRMVNPDLNNSEVKQFGRNSFLFFKGTKSETQALSTPANAVIHDEFDKSDIEQASVYVSRLQHKPHKLRKLFSTPTVEGYGISKEAETSRRMRMICTCRHCNHKFLPDYFTDVTIPGFEGEKVEIKKSTLHKIRWREAWLKCPKCGRDPELHASRMEYVCENPSEQHVATTWYVSPFCVPNIISPSYLVQSSTQFDKFSEFKNQVLGLTDQSPDDTITLKDLQAVCLQGDLRAAEPHYIGVDLGSTTPCRITVGRPTSEDDLLVVHNEKCHYTELLPRLIQLSKTYHVHGSVLDSEPLTDLVRNITLALPNSWGAFFFDSPAGAEFELRPHVQDGPPEGKAMNLVRVNRDLVLDSLLEQIKSQSLFYQSCPEDVDFQNEMMSLKRVQKLTKNGLKFTWQKTGTETDHYHFSLLYLKIAVAMRKLQAPTPSSVSVGLPGLIRVRPKLRGSR